ncbi:MAG: hypothetical protein AMJ81_02160 [Phycisphaerae bacterium SM23_33]|nr:MAG: hypothetical protein AMJ81_02160 [Phycisphaerae bacterium SM23_33]
MAPPAGRRWEPRLRARLQPGRDAPQARRARRVALLLAGAWLINGFDLAFTLLATGHRHFVELNPIAASIIHNTPALVAYKVFFVAFGSLILLRFRTRLLTEVGCWSVCAIYSGLAGMWWRYYFTS